MDYDFFNAQKNKKCLLFYPRNVTNERHTCGTLSLEMAFKQLGFIACNKRVNFAMDGSLCEVIYCLNILVH